MPQKRICPYCPNSPLHRSKPRGLIDWFFKLLGREPVRCHNCERRFYIKPAR